MAFREEATLPLEPKPVKIPDSDSPFDVLFMPTALMVELFVETRRKRLVETVYAESEASSTCFIGETELCVANSLEGPRKEAEATRGK